MFRNTIDYGIYLGAAYSQIALCAGTEVEVFKNNEGHESTPSVVSLDRKGRIAVGRRAKERAETEPENTASEFMIQMGTDWEKVFGRDGKKMRAHELTAEVLKQLRADVKQKNGEDVRAAVITVPAAFELGQCEATNKAAKKAGFDQVVLVMEPVAAALAYGFQSRKDKVFSLVYEFGGGTFDAALIQVRDGLIQVVNHAGANHLGGKLIDWAIVEQLFIPALTKKYSLSDFGRSNPKWRGAIAKLKFAAEMGKTRVSGQPSTEVIIDSDLCTDDRGDKVQFEYELTQAEVEKLAAPFIIRTINICKKMLQEKRLGAGDVEKVFLVGHSTLSPYMMRQLLDPVAGLGVALEYAIDPSTVVARGAAIFAATQPLVGEKKELAA
jgi:molecular chaperone DnaK